MQRYNFLKRNRFGETPLQVAAINNDVRKVQTFLEAGANPNVKDNAGWTPLHEAVLKGHLEIAKLLIKHGASVNAKGDNNDTPLHDAVCNNKLDCVKLLLFNGADIMAENLHGKTPLDLAHTEPLKSELEGTATPITQNYSLPPSSKLYKSLWDPASAKCLNKSTIRQKSNQSKICNKNGESPLQVATIKGDKKKVKKLLMDGANPNNKDNAGWTPLHEAAFWGYSNIAELLLKHGASINFPGLDNVTPLHDAVSNNHLDCVKLLVAHGANVNARNLYGKTPLQSAKTDGIKEILLNPSIVSDKFFTFKPFPVKKVKTEKTICLASTSLSKKNRRALDKVAKLFKLECSDKFTAKVTHLITEVNDEVKFPQIQYLSAILNGSWVVTTSWLTACLEKKQLVAEDEFEVTGCSTHPDSQGAQKGRLNRIQQLPGLFNGCQFYFHGDFKKYTKEELVSLVSLGGGTILKRKPRIVNLTDDSYTYPYHATETSALYNCSIFIIHDDTCSDPPHAEGQHMVCLPVDWLLYSVAAFTLID